MGRPSVRAIALVGAALAAAACGSTTVGGNAKKCTRDADCKQGEVCTLEGCQPAPPPPPRPTRLALVGPNALVIGRCAPYSVATLGEDGQPTNVGAETQVALTAAASGKFFADPECATEAAGVALAAERGVGLFWFSAPAAERFVMIAEAAQLAPARLPVEVGAVAGPPSRLLISGPTSITPGTCAAFTVTAADTDENASVLSADAPVDLSGAGFGAFYASPGCAAAPATRVTLAAGTSSRTFFFQDPSAESVVLVADAPRLGQGRLVVQVTSTAGPPDRLTVAGPRIITQAACAAYTVSSADASGQASRLSAGATLTLSSVSEAAFYGDPACTQPASTPAIEAGASATTVYFRDLLPGAIVLGAAAPELKPGHLPVIVLAVASYPTRLELEGPPSVPAAQCAEYAVRATDPFGNEVRALADTVVELSGAGSGGFFLDAGCQTPIATLTLLEHAARAPFHFRDPAPETVTLHAAAEAFESADLEVAVLADAARALALEGPATVLAAQCERYTVTTLDAHGQPADVQQDRTARLTGAGQGAFYIDPGCLYAAAQVVVLARSHAQTFYFRDAAVEELTLAADADGLTGASLALSVLARPAADMALAGPQALTAGECAGPYTVTLSDAGGIPTTVSALTTLALAGRGHGTFYSDAECATAVDVAIVAPGTGAQSFYFRARTKESLLFAASDPAGAIASASLAVEVAAAALAEASVDLETSFPGGTGAVTVTVRTTSPWSGDGLLLLAFPAGFDLTGVSIVQVTGANGVFTVSAQGVSLTIARHGGAELPAGSLFRAVFAGVGNPTASGDTGPFAVAIAAHDGAVIDEAAVPGFTLSIGALTNPRAWPDDDVAGHLGPFFVEFFLPRPFPTTGSVDVLFPAGFDVAGATWWSATADGTPGVSVSGQTVTFTRTDGSVVLPVGTQFLVGFGGVRNPRQSGPTGKLLISTRDSGGALMDQGSAAGTVLVPAAIDDAEALLENPHAGATGFVLITFTPVNPVPASGRVEFVFPAGFDLTAAQLPPAIPVQLTISGQTATLESGSGAELPAGTLATFLIEGVKNPSAEGTTGAYAVTTRTASGAAIDTGTAAGTEILAPGPSLLGSPSADLPWPNAGAANAVGFTFTLANPWPADGKIVITFPAGFNVGGAGLFGVEGPPGTYTLAVSGQTVTITRTGAAAEAPAGSTVTVRIGCIANPGTTGATGAFAIATTDSAGEVIDAGSAPSVSLGAPLFTRVNVPATMANHTAIADFDLDGRPDFAVPNQDVNGNSSNTVSVFPNRQPLGQPLAASHFPSRVDFAGGGSPFGAAAGDLNLDGRPDLVVANQGGNSASVYVNQHTAGAAFGVSSLAAKVDFATPSNTYRVAVADLNGDGKPDLLATGVSGRLSVFINQHVPGQPFTPASLGARIAFGSGSGDDLAAADLDADGRPDVAVTTESTSLAVFHNEHVPGAAFGPSSLRLVMFPIAGSGVGSYTVAVADLTGDGRPELAVGSYVFDGAAHQPGLVSVLVNQQVPGAAFGTASFSAQTDLQVCRFPNGLAVGDLNGDGRPDLALANALNGTADVLVNQHAPGAVFASASFKPSLGVSVPGFPTSAAIADFTGDGKPDLAIANRTVPAQLALFVNQQPFGRALSAASYAAPLRFATAGRPYFVAIADLDMDGKKDLVTANWSTANVSLFFNQHAPGAAFAAASFGARVDVTTMAEPRAIAVGDLNGDFKPELVASSGAVAGVAVLVNAHTPGGSHALSFPGPSVNLSTQAQTHGVAIGDFTSDGKPEIVASNWQTGNTLSVLVNEDVPGSAFASSDFPSRGDPFAGGPVLFAGLADLNADGLRDLFAANEGGGVSVIANAHAPGAAFGGASFGGRIGYAAAGQPSYAAPAADFDGDGKLDFAVANFGGTSISVLPNAYVLGQPLTTTSFGPRVDFAVAGSPFFVAAGDLDGDGKPDLVSANFSTGNISILRNVHVPGQPISTASFAPPFELAAAASPGCVAIGDLNGDGKPDLAVGDVSNDSGVRVYIAQ